MGALALSMGAGWLGQSQASLEPIAAELRKTGARVTISDVEVGYFEIWFEFLEPCSNTKISVLHDLPSLGAVRLLKGGFDDSGILQMKNLPGLHTLVIQSDKLSDRCMDAVANMKALVKLDLMKAKLTQAGTAKLKQLPKLSRLYFYSATMSPDSYEPLKALKQLKVLYLPTSTPSKVIRALKEAIPNTQIVVL